MSTWRSRPQVAPLALKLRHPAHLEGALAMATTSTSPAGLPAICCWSDRLPPPKTLRTVQAAPRRTDRRQHRRRRIGCPDRRPRLDRGDRRQLSARRVRTAARSAVRRRSSPTNVRMDDKDRFSGTNITETISAATLTYHSSPDNALLRRASLDSRCRRAHGSTSSARCRGAPSRWCCSPTCASASPRSAVSAIRSSASSPSSPRRSGLPPGRQRRRSSLDLDPCAIR